MQFTPEAQRILSDLARRYGISPEAAQVVFRSLAANDGRMAQFDHPDLAGMGQWLRGGMTMVGDMVNGRLKQHMDAFCSDLGDLLQRMGAAGAAGPAARGWAEPGSASPEQPASSAPTQPVPGGVAAPRPAAPAPGNAACADPLTLIERLAELRRKDVLTEAEFTAKKTELLGRL